MIANISAPQCADGATAVEEEFLELVYGDEDLLRAEFDAIIAAEWPDASPPLRPRRRAQPPPVTSLHSLLGMRRQAGRPRHPGADGWARQRAPPGRHACRHEIRGR